MPGSRVRVPPLLLSEAPSSQIDAGLFLEPAPGGLVLGTTLGTMKPRNPPPFHVLTRCDSLPTVPVVSLRDKPPINSESHRRVAVPELTRDNLHRSSHPQHSDGPVVPSIVKA